MNSLYRTMFFVPGNDPKKIIGAEIYRPDCIIYDLEDSVSIFEKDSARILVKYALQYNRPDCRVGIRINQADSPYYDCLLYTSPSPRDRTRSRMPSSA